jgi:glycine/sarcosine N-methyltransferase
MSFYEEISKYYDEIFPVSDETVQFIRGIAGNPPKSILDIACGTGGYSLELEKHGYDLTAVDLDSEMIENLKLKAEKIGSKVIFFKADMLDLKEKLKNKLFDVVFCIGNSLVHLEDINNIMAFLTETKKVLKNDGTLIIQTINFDRILSKNVKSLPTISNKNFGLSFERFYRYEEDIKKIFFKTILSVDKKKFENEIPLIPIKYDEIINMLRSAGFTKLTAYGDFKNSIFDKENSYMMIIKAE